jgi:RimJ/RimL family protein N-acetyltransferase
MIAASTACAERYPAELEQDLVLRDGARLHVRPIRADDAERLIAFYDRLSRHTAYQRFVSIMRRLPPDWARLLAGVDYVRRLALVATADQSPDAAILAVARYEPTNDPATAEVAFVVQDGWQGRGLGTRLLCVLLDAARARGIARFRAYVLANNTRMLDLLARFTDVQEQRIEQGVVELVFSSKACAARPPD